MSENKLAIVESLLVCLTMSACAALARGQQPPAPAPLAAAVSPETVAGDSPSSELARKATILNSDCWRQAMFQWNDWLRVQTVFPREEVARIKRDFAARVERMSADELQLVLSDLQVKFKILDTPEARDVRAWFGHYVSILADRRREEVVREIPDVATMTSGQLQQTIDRLALRRDTRAQQNAHVQQARNRSSNPWVQGGALPSRGRPRAAYRSPYRPRPTERPFENVRTSPTRSWTVDPSGGMWRNISF